MAKRKKVEEKEPADFGDYLLCNHDKLERVINGVVGQGGKLAGGLGKDAAPEAIIAEYDRLGGLILTKDGEKVAIGSFYDFENKTPRNAPLIIREKSKKGNGPQVNVTEVGEEDRPKRRGRKPRIEEE